MRENLPAPAEVKHVLQQAVLRNYPNPERSGCPGTKVLEQTARQLLPPEDDHWMHIVHCSPCYREFLDFRHAYLTATRRARLRSGILKAIGIAVVLLAVTLLFWLLWQAP